MKIPLGYLIVAALPLVFIFYRVETDEELQAYYKKSDCVEHAFIYRQHGVWNGTLYCEKEDNNFFVAKSSIFRAQLKRKLNDDINRHTFCRKMK